MFFLWFRGWISENCKPWFEVLSEVLFHLFPVQSDVRLLRRTHGQDTWIVAEWLEKEKRPGPALRESCVYRSWSSACEGKTPALRFWWLRDDVLRNIPLAAVQGDGTFAVVSGYQGRSASEGRETSLLLYPLAGFACDEIVWRKERGRGSVGLNSV